MTQVTSACLGPKPVLRFISGNTALSPTSDSPPTSQPTHNDADFDHLPIPFALVVNVPLVTMTPENGSTGTFNPSHLPLSLQHTHSPSHSVKHTSNNPRNLARHPRNHEPGRPRRRPRRARQRPHHPLPFRSASRHPRPLPTYRQERQRDHPRPAPLAWREAESHGRAEGYACDEYVPFPSSLSLFSHGKVGCGLMWG